MSEAGLKIDLFCCANSVEAEDLRSSCGKVGAGMVKVIGVPCSGKVDLLYLLKAFEGGADGVAVITCKVGDCHYLEGNLRAQKRSGAVDGLLDEVGLGRGRIIVIESDGDGAQGVIRRVGDFCEKLRSLPPVGGKASESVVSCQEN